MTLVLTPDQLRATARDLHASACIMDDPAAVLYRMAAKHLTAAAELLAEAVPPRKDPAMNDPSMIIPKRGITIAFRLPAKVDDLDLLPGRTALGDAIQNLYTQVCLHGGEWDGLTSEAPEALPAGRTQP